MAALVSSGISLYASQRIRFILIKNLLIFDFVAEIFLTGMTKLHIFLFTLFSIFASTATAEPFNSFRDCDACPEMIELPLGEFLMGSPLGEQQSGFRWQKGHWRLTNEETPFYNYREQPIHPVTVDVPIAMGRNEVTYDEWMACVDDGACNGYVPDVEVLVKKANGDVTSLFPKGGHPVVRVSYLDALTYIDWLNEKTGAMLYRLPTEVEWEYAARAGTRTPYAQGMDATKDQINYGDVVWMRERANGDPHEIMDAGSVSVEELDAANAWGLRHMSGNVGEITMSCWTEQHELWSLSSQYLRNAEETQTCEDRVVRGGSFFFGRVSARVGSRSPTDDDARVHFDGFRVMRNLD